jgi:RNA-directed DNA polymerase
MVAIPSAAELAEAILRNNVTWFSSQALGVPYSQLKRMLYPRPPYKHFTITKRNGSPRVIAEPRQRLKVIQKRVLAFLEARSGPFKPAVHGFVPKRSIVTNARTHCSTRNHHVLNLDLQDFFPSISFYRVRGVLRKHPFNFSHQVATTIAHICTLDKTLPQGAPTSPFLSNLVCRSMDRDLTDLARRNLARYTRYADDITFSFPVKKTSRLPTAICVVDDDGGVTIGGELHDLITSKHHFTINAAKTRLSDRFRRMEVTGLTINKFPNVPRIFIDRIRGALNAWERNGYDAAENGWREMVTKAASGPYERKPWKRQTRGGSVPKLKNVLWGKLLYLRMVRGKDDLIYTRLAERFNAAVDFEQSLGAFSAPKLPVEPVVRDHETAHDAVFVLEWKGDYHSSPGHHEDALVAQGTAFAYRELNLLVTCDHVFEAKAKVGKMESPTDFQAPEVVNKALNLVRPGTTESWPARILYRNKQYDFAILKFEDPVPPHRYFSAMDAPIKSRADGILIGFPAYKNWNLADQNDQKVLNRTLPNPGMFSFTISGAGSIRPGNSGGPFTDDRFRVAGMAQRGAYMGEGHDECLCFEVADTFIAAWKAKSKPALALAPSTTPTAPLPPNKP